MSSIEPPTDSDITVLSRTGISSSSNNEKFHDKDALSIGAKVGEFEITRYIGRGGFGIVYLAFDRSLHREVALKEYMQDEFAIRGSNAKVVIKSGQHEDKEAFQRGLRSFVNEARLLARFNHPSFAKIYRFWEENDTAYIAMEYCQGKTFKEKLSELDNSPDEVWLKEMLSHLLDALNILHRENCLHRDISPDNILFRPNGQPVLIDFGAARYVKNNTQPPTVIVKPGYSPREQYGNEEKQGPWTDISALAVVIYFAITGKIPRPKSSDQLKPLSQSVKKNHYTRKFLNAIDRALSDKPENRPQSVEEFRNMLGLTENSISSVPRNSKKNRLGIILAIAALLIAIAVFLFPVNTPPSSQPEPYNPIKVLDEIYQNRDPTHIVNVAIEKEVLRIGKDLLRLKISSTKPGYVYIFVIGTDRDSSFYRIFLSEDKENYINTTSPLEAKYEMMGPPGESHYIVIVSEYKRNLRNLSSSDVTIGNPECPQNITANCNDSYGATQFSINEVYQ